MTSPPAPLPDSGDGLAPPAPDALPHPALWEAASPGRAPRPFDGKLEDDADIPPRTPARTAAIWGSVAAMLLGAVLVAVAVVVRTAPLAVAGVVVGLCGLVGALRAKILLAVSVGESPTGPG